jgi:hypothetical protein
LDFVLANARAGYIPNRGCLGEQGKKKGRLPLIVLLILHNLIESPFSPGMKVSFQVNDADISARADRVADSVRHNPA